MTSKMQEIFDKMTPEQRKEVGEAISEMMGMPEEKLSHTFKGVAQKIVIESADGALYVPPEPGQEIRQRLTINRNGTVTLTRYFSGDYSQVPPTADTRTTRRYSGKDTNELMDLLAECFKKPYVPAHICDTGIWVVALWNEDGERFSYSGSLGSSPVSKYNLSMFARYALKMDTLWMFDGTPADD